MVSFQRNNLPVIDGIGIIEATSFVCVTFSEVKISWRIHIKGRYTNSAGDGAREVEFGSIDRGLQW